MLYLDLSSNKLDPPNPLGKGGHELRTNQINRISQQINS